MKPLCKYDPNCYRTSVEHRAQYRHTIPTTASTTAPHVPSTIPPAHTAATHSSVEDDDEASNKRRKLSPQKPLAPKYIVISDENDSKNVNTDEQVVSTKTSLEKVSSSVVVATSPPRTTDISLPPLPPKGKCDDFDGSDALRNAYHLRFPREVLDIYRCIASTATTSPCDYFKDIYSWSLVGPFEVLHNYHTHEKKDAAAPPIFSSVRDAWLHWRFPADPPELMTVAVQKQRRGDADVVTSHVSLLFDDPREPPTCVVLGHITTTEFKIVGLTLAEGLFAVISTSCADNSACAALARCFSPLLTVGKGNDPEHIIKRAHTHRYKVTIAPTFSRLGIVCPYDKKTEVGYREMMVSDAQLKTILKGINSGKITPKQRETLEEQLRFSDIANDESDFGLNLQLGQNFFSFVEKKNQIAADCVRILDVAYMLLGRSLFQSILIEVMNHRLSPEGSVPKSFIVKSK